MGLATGELDYSSFSFKLGKREREGQVGEPARPEGSGVGG